MRFGILGPLRVSPGGSEVAVTASRDRTVLAMLLLRAGSAVPVDQLVAAVWSGSPPRSARNQLQACVSQLRRRLTSAGIPADAIATEPDGYRLVGDPRQVDAHEFRARVAQARAAAAAGQRQQASDHYRSAIGLWRGPALSGVESDELRRVATALDEERFRAIEECIDVELALGAGGQLVAELTDLATQHPYREGLHGALMRALYRAGRPAEALAAFRRARRLLREELGTEPGEQLQQLHRAILNRDRTLAAPAPAPAPALASTPAPAAEAAPVVPRELPVEVSAFVGRTAETARIREILVATGPTARRRPPVVVLYGPGGVGKSALAVRVGHELAPEFPDGQLYVDLCGSTPGMRPLPAVEVLGRLLRRLGVPPREVPAQEGEAAALFRSVATDRRLLLVLDNAADHSQVAPLLPGSRSCAVLVTGRRPMPSLDADDRLRVGPLTDAEGMALLTGLTQRITAEPAAARQILALSGGLPLALRVAAGRLASRPDLSVTAYAQRLADRSRRLDELELADLAVRACIRTSYDALLTERGGTGRLAARAFRVLGLLHVPDVAPGVVAAMLREPDPGTARAALDRLVDVQLLDALPGGRYRLHDLVRLVATERATAEDETADRDRAVERALSYYTGVLDHANRLVRSDDPGGPFGDPPPAEQVALSQFGDPAEARRWVDIELPCIVAVVGQTITAPGRAARLALRLGYDVWSSLDSRGSWHLAHWMTSLLVKAATTGSDSELTGFANLLHGRSEASLGNCCEAIPHLERAIKVFRESGHGRGTTVALIAMGVVHDWLVRPELSIDYYSQALRAAQESGFSSVKGALFNNMSVSYLLLGKLDQALAAGQSGAAVSVAMGNSEYHASALINLASVHNMRDEPAEAVQYVTESLALSRRMGDRVLECEALVVRSVAYLQLGRLSAAETDANDALWVARAAGHQHGAAAARQLRHRILAAAGRPEEAGRAGAAEAEAFAPLDDAHRDPIIDLLLSSPAILRTVGAG